MKVQEPARGGSAEKQSPRRPGDDGVDISSGQRSAVSRPAGPTSLVGNPHLSWDSAMKRKRDRAGGELRTPMCLRAPMCLLASFLCFKAKCPQATPCGQCPTVSASIRLWGLGQVPPSLPPGSFASSRRGRRGLAGLTRS